MIRESSAMSALPEISGRRWISRQDLRDSTTTIARGSLIGTAIGAIPGTGTDIGAFLSYSEAKRRPKGRIPFGRGNPQASRRRSPPTTPRSAVRCACAREQ
ncbi:tripartite tricarboxylate transporter permease [Georgenia sp. SUBG003]|uniref:tripartite tricarboxylate transporter permease n=1 Tax=Georgenia sp. SUBG003 TaxID=1497974 RepID=UPI003AB68B05